MSIASVIPTIGNLAAKIGFQITKHAPEILTYGGIATMGVGTGLAVKQSFRYMEKVTEPEMVHLYKIQETLDNSKTYTTNDARHDRALVYSRLLVRTITHYALPLGVFAAGAAMVVSGHNIVSKRLAQSIAAYGALNTAYENLKNRLVAAAEDDFNQESYDHILETDVVRDEQGVIDRGRSVSSSPYTFVFDVSNPNYTGDQGQNDLFLSSTQNYLNDRLQARGHVFLNEVLEALGFEDTPEGALTGWVKNGEGDGYISFGVSGHWNERYDHETDVMTDDYILDFNVDGIIWDKI